MWSAVAVLRHFPLLDVGISEILEDGTLEELLACFFRFLPDIGPPGFVRGRRVQLYWPHDQPSRFYRFFTRPNF